jgi:hypothetical protein
VLACTEREFGYNLFNLGEAQTVTLSRTDRLLENAWTGKPSSNAASQAR